MNSVQKFSATSPTRVDLAGGTLDLWPLSALISDAKTVNAAIDCFTYCEFSKNQSASKFEIKVTSPDFEKTFVFQNYEEIEKDQDSLLSLIKQSFNLVEDKSLLEGLWVLDSQSPAGSGLGGSSSLLVSILKVIFQVLEMEPSENEYIEMAKNIESKVLNAPAGIQDYFSPLKPGINVVNFVSSGYKRHILEEDVLQFWQDRLSIVDSQIKHHSGMNNWEVLKSAVDGHEVVLEALQKLAVIASDVEDAIMNFDVDLLASCFDRELKERRVISKDFISKKLSALLQSILAFPQVKAAKVCGAGGGGCALLLHEPSEKENLGLELTEAGYSVLPFKLHGGEQ